MRVPLSWLKDYIDVRAEPGEISDRLTFSGTEVEGMEKLGSTYEGLIVGEVRSVEKHPNADRLSVCRVFDGQQELQVVCGAPNVKAGEKYPFAPVGVTMPDGQLKIKEARLRGVDSHGMLCSEVELGLSEEKSGLMVLDPQHAAGTPLSAVLGPPEVIFELEVTPNRPDCLSMIGMARELSAIYRIPLKKPVAELKETGEPTSKLTRVDVIDTKSCPRYTARILKNIRVAPSPRWMQQRLQAAGIRAINNIVDITNYVMLECGQPLHAFDQTLLKEGRIVVRKANAGETITTLDGVERKLDASMLVIADAEKPMALAGIMGGAGSEIHQGTTTVLLESAYFEPTGIRATSKRLGLSSESSYRFERNVDIEQIEWASRRAASLMVELAGAEIASGVIDIYPQPWQEQKIPCRFDRVRSVLGLDVSNDTISDVLGSLQLRVETRNAKEAHVAIPSFRIDLHAEIDLIEEFSRIYGLDKIPAPPPRAETENRVDDRNALALQALREKLVGLGLREIVNYSLVSENLLNLFDRNDTAQRVVLPRPISSDQSILRNSLIPQMVETLGKNKAHQIAEAGFFEIGRVFFINADGKIAEETRLAIGLMGPIGRTDLNRRKPAPADEIFLRLKGILENVAQTQKMKTWSLSAAVTPYFEKDFGTEVSFGGVMGLIKNDIRKEWRLNEPVAVLEIKTQELLEAGQALTAFTAFAPYPSVTRDVAFVVEQGVRHEDVVKTIRNAAPPELETVELFDIFSGGNLEKNKKSMAYSLTYRSAARTLTDEEANGYHTSIKEILKKTLNADLRES